MRLGEVLEAIHNSRHRFETVRAVGRARDKTSRLWWQRPSRLRIEADDQVTVQIGVDWWRWSPGEGATSNHGDAHFLVGTGPLEHLLDPTPLLAAALELVGEGEVAGRRAALLTARRRPGRDRYVHGGWWFEGELSVAIDIDAGIALRSGEVELTAVAFDDYFAPTIFAPPFPRGVAAKPTAALAPRAMSVEAAKASVPFPLLVPSLLPDGARLTACSVDAHDPPRWVDLSYIIDPGARNVLHLRLGPGVPAPDTAPAGSMTTIEDGVEFTINERGGDGFHSVELLLQRDDLHVMIHSDLARDVVVAIGRSLEPA